MTETHTNGTSFITFRMPIVKTEGMVALCEPNIDFSVPSGFFNMHYKTKWIEVPIERTLIEKILFQHPTEDIPIFHVEIVLKVCYETEDYIEHIKLLPEVTSIPTPEDYEF